MQEQLNPPGYRGCLLTEPICCVCQAYTMLIRNVFIFPHVFFPLFRVNFETLSADLATSGGCSKDGGAPWEHQRESCIADPQLTVIFSTSERWNWQLTLEATAGRRTLVSEMSESHISSPPFWSVPLPFISSHIIACTYRNMHIDLPVVTRQGHGICDGRSQAKVTSFNANALFSPLLMSGCDS